MLWYATSLNKISWVFKELTSIISKITCSADEKHDSRRFFENKVLFFNERYMFLVLACWNKRMLSNATHLKRISLIFKQLSLIIAKISCSVCDRHENRCSFVNKSLFFNERFMFFSLTCRVKWMLSNAKSSKRYLFFHIVIIDHRQNIVFRSRRTRKSTFLREWILFFSEWYMFLRSSCGIKWIVWDV